MRVPVSWLREHAAIPAAATPREIAAALVRVGLEVETVEPVGAGIEGPLVVGEVLSFEEEQHRNGKTVRWCQVGLGDGYGGARGIVCGARNFAVGDKVVVAPPGTTLPGGFHITARTTYGHVSDGMICSARELGVGEDATGILVLPTATVVGTDALQTLGLPDAVLDIAVTPDRGYALSVRGVAREAAAAYGVELRDPADPEVAELSEQDLAVDGAGHPAAIEDLTAADRIVLRTVAGVDPGAQTPLVVRQRLAMCGMRAISLPVDVTNYVMLELGQPLHAFDRRRLQGAVVVRRARAGERLETLDHVTRALHPRDVLIADQAKPLSLAGTMGGVDSECDDTTTDIVVEAAHFDPVATARMSRRHRLSSEASRRFERGVDPHLPAVASARAVALLRSAGGADVVGSAEVTGPVALRRILYPPARAASVGGMPVADDEVERALGAVGCTVRAASSSSSASASASASDGARLLEVEPPSWRPDLTTAADLDEEVLRLVGYDRLPSTLPRAPAGRGFSDEQRLRRRVGTALAWRGFVEAPTYPFLGEQDLDALGLPADDVRRRGVALLNPLSDERPLLRTTLLPGLLAALRRNVSRGTDDVALFETGLVFRTRGTSGPVPRPGTASRPSAEEVAALDAALPTQPRHVGVVACGAAERAGWWGAGRPVAWSDAVAAARLVAAAAGTPPGSFRVEAADRAPWHPGRCATVHVADHVVGCAGELHPRVVAALGLPPGTVAAELDLDAVAAVAAGTLAAAAPVSPYPVAAQDVALVVADGVPAADVEAALREGAGDLLEDVRLFDVYTGPPVPPGHRSLAYALRLRAADRTLTAAELASAREAAVAAAAERTGAVLRG